MISLVVLPVASGLLYILNYKSRADLKATISASHVNEPKGKKGVFNENKLIEGITCLQNKSLHSSPLHLYGSGSVKHVNVGNISLLP